MVGKFVPIQYSKKELHYIEDNTHFMWSWGNPFLVCLTAYLKPNSRFLHKYALRYIHLHAYVCEYICGYVNTYLIGDQTDKCCAQRPYMRPTVRLTADIYYIYIYTCQYVKYKPMHMYNDDTAAPKRFKIN